MRDPATRIDPDVEAAVEETRRFLEPYVRSPTWAADPDGLASDMGAALEVIENCEALPDWVRLFAWRAMHPQTKRRSKKPTRRFRNMALRMAAARLLARGYDWSRNDETRHVESASSIIHEALKRLGVKKMKEKQVTNIVLSTNPEIRELMVRAVRE
jgi:hypothetical protein